MLPFWKIVGFALYVALYMIACDGLNQWPEENLRSVAFKVLPVLQCFLIVMSSKSQEPGYLTFNRSILMGLTLSMCGDALLVYEKYREIGGACFAFAHVCYLRGMGLRPLGGGPTLASFLVLLASVSYYMYPFLTGVDLIASLGYLALLHTMAWRGTVRYHEAPSLVNFLACIGCILFVASDIVLLSDWFLAKRPLAPAIVMGTYYLAQLGITMAATDDFTPTFYDAKSKAE